MLDAFNKLVLEKKVVITSLKNLRVKLHTPCQWSCNFCHMEGNHSSTAIKSVSELENVLIFFRDTLLFTEVHFTGGEPTIHPQIIEFISMSKKLGLTVKMTTNGQVPTEKYLQMIDNGLDELNMSIHTLNGKSLGLLMNPVKDMEWGKRAIAKQLELVNNIKGFVKVKINTVASNFNDVMQIATFAESNKIPWRVMDELEHSEESFLIIQEVSSRLQAVPVMAHLIKGSSSCSITMECPTGFTYKVKMIRPFQLEPMCNDCPIHKDNKCFEFAYGPRLEAQKEKLFIRSCIYRDGNGYTEPFETYVNHEFVRALKAEL